MVRSLLALGALALTMTNSLSAQASPLAGDWTGTLTAGAVELRIVFHVAFAEGAHSATMDSPDQGVNGIPVTSVALVGDTVTLGISAIGGGFTGTLAPDGERMEGTWSQGAVSLPLALQRSQGPVEAPKRPQEPREPFPYSSTDVHFEGGAPDVTLAGTLTLPSGLGPFPAVILITGSGPQNRDEQLLGHRPFLVLADHLTRKGVAVLRYDDRGVAGSTGDFASATSQDFGDDAAAALRFLRGRPEIDAERVGLIGHSEGGLIAPMVASRDEGVAFAVLMAGPGVDGGEILALQTGLILAADGSPTSRVEEQVTRTRELNAFIVGYGDKEGLQQALVERLTRLAEGMTEAERQTQGVTSAAIQAQAATLSSPWFRFFLGYDPVPALRSVRVPVLALNGGKDLQVPPRANLEAIAAALADGGNPDVTTRELPGLNHLFQTATTGAPSEYAKIEETMSPVALNLMSNWILERFGPG